MQKLKRYLKHRGIFLCSSFPFFHNRNGYDLSLSEFRSVSALNGNQVKSLCFFFFNPYPVAAHEYAPPQLATMQKRYLGTEM